MGFIYHKESGLLHFYSRTISYVMKINSHKIVEHLYFGKRIRDLSFLKQEGCENFQYHENGRFENPEDYYPNISRNEFGSHLRMDLRPSSFIVSQNDDELTDFRFVSFSRKRHNEYEENYPHVRNEKDATRVTLKLKDAYRNIYLYATYTLFEKENILIKSTRIENKTRKSLTLKKIVSSTMDFEYQEQTLIHFPGRWAKERQYQEERLGYGDKILFSMEGRSGHYENPFFIVGEKHLSERDGECYSFNLLYSGNFKNEIYVSSTDKLRINVGINDNGFSYFLKKGESFLAPEVVIAYSENGLDSLSQTNHTFIKNHILPETSKAPLPLIFNSWEGTGMDFNLESIKAYAKVAKEIGAELFVLDDGWFSSRNDDQHGLGDWYVNKKKVDLVELSNYVHSLGMKFGIWLEPEMVNIDTKLYKEHPEWVISHPDLEKLYSRNQLVLDFSNPTVREHILSSIKNALNGVKVDYIKYDMNRYLADIYSNSTPQGELFDKNIRGVYAFMHDLLKHFPNILFENCASGGGRFDLGMLYFSPFIWCSDNTNPKDRTYIQYGTSFGYPSAVISSHVSQANASYLDKASVAFMGTYGYEMNPLKLTDEDKALLSKYDEYFHKYHEEVIKNGEIHRYANPFKDGYLAELSLSKDKKKGFLLCSLVKDQENEILVHLQDLIPSKKYEINGNIYKGSFLIRKGYSFKALKKEGQTQLLFIMECAK